MRQIYVPLLAMIIFLLFWEALVWVNDWPNYKMASPSDRMGDLLDLSRTISSRTESEKDRCNKCHF